MTSAGEKLLDKGTKTVVATDEGLGVDLLASHVDLPLNVLVVSRQASEQAKVLLGLLVAALGHEPSRGFGNPEHQKAQNRCREDLNCRWELPLEGVALGGRDESVVDPETSQSTAMN